MEASHPFSPNGTKPDPGGPKTRIFYNPYAVEKTGGLKSSSFSKGLNQFVLPRPNRARLCRILIQGFARASGRMRGVALLFYFAGVPPSKMTKDESPLPPSTLEALCRSGSSYAGIGSRSSPRPALILISRIARVLADYGLILRSGGAPGADTAFEEGCDQGRGKKEIFLPWKGFNKNASPLYTPPGKAEEIAALLHPNWRAVRPQYRAFHARNVQQVYGLDLDTAASFVLFWAPEENGRVQGGTATAVHLAREMRIPTFNLWNPAISQQWREVVASYRERNKRISRRHPSDNGSA